MKTLEYIKKLIQYAVDNGEILEEDIQVQSEHKNGLDRYYSLRNIKSGKVVYVRYSHTQDVYRVGKVSYFHFVKIENNKKFFYWCGASNSIVEDSRRIFNYCIGYGKGN